MDRKMIIMNTFCLMIWVVIGGLVFASAKKNPDEPHWSNFTGWFMWFICILHFIQSIIMDLGV